MSFSTSPKNGPIVLNPTGAKAVDSSALSARERAMAAFNAPKNPVQNPSNVSAEEMGAINPTKSVESSQSTTAEATQSQAETAEAAKEAPPAKKPEETPLSAQYAQLARKEKALRMKDQELKAREAAFKASQEASKTAPGAQEPSPKDFISKDRLQKDPIGVLVESGLTPEQITQMILNGDVPSKAQEFAHTQVIDELREEIKALKAAQETTSKTFEQVQKQNYEQAVNQIKNEVTALVNSDPNFEAVKHTNSIDDVVDLIKKTFEEDKILMTAEEAAKEIEDYLQEEAYKLSQLKRVQERLKPKTPGASQASASAEKQQAAPSNQQSQPKTLTNQMTNARPLTARERAILAFEGKNKQ